MTEQVASTAPTINTDLLRAKLHEPGSSPQADYYDEVLELCDAVDTLRKHFEAQQVYINAMERRWNDVPHGEDCNKTANTPCDCWKARA